ncbi:MAG: shikimate kinase [Lachnospiraceae bacterium]|nr:shikimate kinase [Lachnospiraceae bacterium]
MITKEICRMKWKRGNNIVLIGMPGVGKSTIGVILAKIMGYKFIDSDIIIQEQEGRLLKDIIADEGIDGFLEIENNVNMNLNVKNAVIATGGSAVYGSQAMKHYKETSTIIYLKLDYEAVDLRLGDIRRRGVVLRDGQTLEDIYIERTLMYDEYSDIVIDETGLNLENTLQTILEVLGI